MANVLSKLCQELCGLTFPRWVASTGPGPARCPVCRKGCPDLGQAPPSAGQRRAPKRRCPLPEATDPTPGEDPSASPEQAPKKPAPALPPGDSALEIPRSPGTLSCQLGVPPPIPKCKPLAQLGEPRTPCDVPLPDPRDAEVKGPEDPKGTPSNGHDISSSQSSTMDRLGANQLQTCSHFQESGKVVEGKKPTALPPPDSQESAKGVVSAAPTASPPTSPAVPSLTARRAPKRKDSQESAKELGVKKPKAHPPPDFQESTKVEGGEMSKDNAPTIPATTNVAPRRASKRKATLPSVLPLPLPQSVPMLWGRTELPPPPKLLCMNTKKDLDICEVTQFTHTKIYKREGTGQRSEVRDDSDPNHASSVPPSEEGIHASMALPTCTASTPARPNITSVEEQAAVANSMPASSSNPKEDLIPKTSSSSSVSPDALLSGNPASNSDVLHKNEDYDHFIRATTLPNSLSKSLQDHCPLPSKKESCTLMCVDSPPLSFPTLPVLPLPIGVNTTTTDSAALTPSISSHVTMQPATDDDVVQMDTTPPSEAIIFSSPTVSNLDTCVFPQVPSSLQQGNFLNGSAPSNLPRPPPCPLPQVPSSLQQGSLLPGPMPTSPAIPHPYPFTQALCSIHQGHASMGSGSSNLLASDSQPFPQVLDSLHQGQILNGQLPSSAFPQVVCSVPQGQLMMGPDPTNPPRPYSSSFPQVPCSIHRGQLGMGPVSSVPPTPYTYPVPKVPYSLHQGQLGIGPAPTNPPPCRASSPSQSLVPQNDHCTTSANPVVQHQDMVPYSGIVSNNQFLQSQPMQGLNPNPGHASTSGALPHPTIGVFNGQSDKPFSLSHPAVTPALGLTAPPIQPPGDSISVIPAMHQQHSASLSTRAAPPIFPNMTQAIIPVPGNGDSSTKPFMDDDNIMDTTPPSEASIFPSPSVLTNNYSAGIQVPPTTDHMPHSGIISSLQDPNNQLTQSQLTQGPSSNTSLESSAKVLPHSTLGIFKGQCDSFTLSHSAALPAPAVGLTAPPRKPPDDTIMQSGNMAMTMSLSAVYPPWAPYTSQPLPPQNDPWATNVIPVVQQQYGASVPTHAAPSLPPNMGPAMAPIPGSGAFLATKPSMDDGNKMDRKPHSGQSHYSSPSVLTNSHSILNQALPASDNMPPNGILSIMQDSNYQFTQSQPTQGPTSNSGHPSSAGALPYPTLGVFNRQSDNFSLSHPAALPMPNVSLTAPSMQPDGDIIMQPAHMTMTAPLSAVTSPRGPNPSQALVPQNDQWTTSVIPIVQQQYGLSIPSCTAALVLPNKGPAPCPIHGSGASPPTKPSMNDNTMDTTPPSEASVFPSSPVLTNTHSTVNQSSPAPDHMPRNGTISSIQDSNLQWIQSQSMQGPSPNTGHQFSTGALPHPTLGVFNGQSVNFSLSHPVTLPTPAVGLTAPATQLSNDIIMQSGHMAMTMPLSTVTPAGTLQQAFCNNSQRVFYTAVPTKTGIKISRQTGSGDTKTSLNQTSPATSATMGNGDPPNAGHMGFGTFTKHLRSKSKASKGCRRQKFKM